MRPSTALTTPSLQALKRAQWEAAYRDVLQSMPESVRAELDAEARTACDPVVLSVLTEAGAAAWAGRFAIQRRVLARLRDDRLLWLCCAHARWVDPPE